MVINGKPHGPLKGTTTCQLHMYHFNDGDSIVIEPWRAKPFQSLYIGVDPFNDPSDIELINHKKYRLMNANMVMV